MVLISHLVPKFPIIENISIPLFSTQFISLSAVEISRKLIFIPELYTLFNRIILSSVNNVKKLKKMAPRFSDLGKFSMTMLSTQFLIIFFIRFFKHLYSFRNISIHNFWCWLRTNIFNYRKYSAPNLFQFDLQEFPTIHELYKIVFYQVRSKRKNFWRIK